MPPEISSSVTFIMMTTAAAIAVAIWTVLSAAASRGGLTAAGRRRVRVGSAIVLGGWLGAVVALAPDGVPAIAGEPGSITPLIPWTIAISAAVVVAALWGSSSLRQAVASVPLPTLHALQAWRVVGIVFVLLLAQGRLPTHFALPAGWGDVAVGLTAPLVALALARKARGAAVLAAVWNVLGLVDLVVAVGMGTGVLAPLLLPELGEVPPVAAMGALPMIIVPTFAVPASTIIHVIALERLRRDLRLRAGDRNLGRREVVEPAP